MQIETVRYYKCEYCDFKSMDRRDTEKHESECRRKQPMRPETDTEKVAALFEGLQDIHVSRNPVLKQVYVSRKQAIPMKRNFWQWLLRRKIEAYLETTVTLDITKDGFIRYKLRNLTDITILKEMIAPVLDRNDVFMPVELPPTCENIDFEKIPGIAYLYP